MSPVYKTPSLPWRGFGGRAERERAGEMKKILPVIAVGIVIGVGYAVVSDARFSGKFNTARMELLYSEDFETGLDFAPGHRSEDMRLRTSDRQCLSTSTDRAQEGAQSLYVDPKPLKFGSLSVKKTLPWKDVYLVEYDVLIVSHYKCRNKNLKSKVASSIYNLFSTGDQHIVAFREDGKVYCCGKKMRSWKPGTWYHVKCRVETVKDSNNIKVYLDVDGSKFYVYNVDVSFREKKRSENQIHWPYLSLSILCMPCYIDNIRIYASDD